MRIKSVFLLFLLPLMAVAAGAQSSRDGTGAASDTALVEGVWRTQMDGLPCITLTVTDESGSLTGAVLFYLLRREPGQPAAATAGIAEPLFNLRFDGLTLTFQVSHRRAHPPRTLKDAPVNFRLRLTGPSRGELSNPNDTSSTIAMVRADY